MGQTHPGKNKKSRTRNKMNLQNRLLGRIHMQDIHEVLLYVGSDNQRKQQLYDLIYHENDIVGYQALWICSHFNSSDNKWLQSKQDQLIDEVLQCQHPGKRRILLNLLFRQPMPNPPRVDFIDFCLERMLSKDELPGVKTLCMKLAYELCRLIPELCQEFSAILDIMEPDLLPISIRTVCKNIKKAMLTKKSIASY